MIFKRLSSVSLILLTLAFCLSFQAGCGYKKEETEAKAFLRAYYNSIGHHQFNSLLSYYSKDAFGPVGPTKALRGMKKAQLSFGRLKSFKLDQSSLVVQKNEHGVITAKLSYSVFYELMETKENFAISKGKGRLGWLINTQIIHRKNQGKAKGK